MSCLRNVTTLLPPSPLGFSLENLEPEKLLISFTALRLGSIAAFDGVGGQGPLDRLNKVVWKRSYDS